MGLRRTEAQKRSYAKAMRQANMLEMPHGDFQRSASALIDEDRAWAKRRHAVERAKERHNVVIDLWGLRHIEAKIATGRPVQNDLLLLGHFDKDPKYRRTSLWLSTIGDRIVPLVYDHDAAAVTTVLPMDGYNLGFKDGVFSYLASGGTKAGRDYWAAIIQ